MEIYIVTLILVTIIAIITSRKKMNRWISIVLVAIPLICISGFRWKVGTDFGTYYNSFREIPNYTLNFLLGESYSDFIPYERGFSVLIWIISRINKHPQFIVFITSLINIGVVIYTLKKYSGSYALSIYLYITTMIYYSAFNGIRQWIASVLFFFAIRYVIERNFKKYLIFVIIASTIHISSFIMIPIYFIVNFKPYGKKMIVVAVICTIIAISMSTFLGNFEQLTMGTRYESYTTISEEENGVNIFRVLVAAVPVIISYLFYNKLKDEKENRILINFSTINLLVFCLATQSTFISRFNMYFELYNLLLYPKFLKLFKKEERYVFLLILVMCFFIYMCLLLPVDSNLLPYRTFWNQ